jgi:hypothetical protein
MRSVTGIFDRRLFLLLAATGTSDADSSEASPAVDAARIDQGAANDADWNVD